MGNDLLKVHYFGKGKGSQERQLNSTKPYIRIKAAQSDMPVFLKEGRAMFEDGVELNCIPEWLAAEINRLNPVVRKESGFAKIDMKAYKKEEPKKEPKPKPKKSKEKKK